MKRILLRLGPGAVRAAKRRRRVIAYDDMLYNLYEALTGGRLPWLAETLRSRFPAALIDEFQDTSPLQYRLFDQIYRTADNSADSALLLIGDPKQSIYGFRGADIYSYLQARQATEGRHYVLDTNFRSTQALVDAVNQWFVQAEMREGESPAAASRSAARSSVVLMLPPIRRDSSVA